MHSFTSGTIFSAGTCSPSGPGTQPVSLNISLASFRRTISSVVIALRMIVLQCSPPWLSTLPSHTALRQSRSEGPAGRPPDTIAINLYGEFAMPSCRETSALVHSKGIHRGAPRRREASERAERVDEGDEGLPPGESDT